MEKDDTSEKVICGNCGEEVPSYFDICPKCGEDPHEDKKPGNHKNSDKNQTREKESETAKNDDLDEEKIEMVMKTLEMIDDETYQVKGGNSSFLVNKIKEFGSKDTDKIKKKWDEEKKKEEKKEEEDPLEYECPICGTLVDEDMDECPGCGAIFEE